MKPKLLQLCKALPLAATIALASGCLSIQGGEDLVVLERRRHDLKAVTSDDARMRVREFRNSHKGDLGFWSRVLKNDFVQSRGYTLLEEKNVVDNFGRQGREYLFHVDLDKSPHRYLVRVSLVDRPVLLFREYVRVAEVLASPEVYNRQQKSLRTALDGLLP